MYSGTMFILNQNQYIEGEVRVIPPDPHAVWHGDVVIEFEEYILPLESSSSRIIRRSISSTICSEATIRFFSSSSKNHNYSWYTFLFVLS